MSDGVPDPNAGLSDSPADSVETSDQGGQVGGASKVKNMFTPMQTPGATYSPVGNLAPAPQMLGPPEMMTILSLTRGVGSANGR